MPFLPLLIASGMSIVDAVSFSIIKHVSKHALPSGLTVLAMVLYALQPLILLQAMPIETVAVMNILWNLISSVVVTLVSIFVLRETIGMYKMVGVVAGIVSLGLCTLT